MSDRRWGRVTVEGWVQENPLRPGQVTVWGQKGLGANASAVTYPPYHYTESRVTVEFLPEPVTFKDGDVVQYTAPGMSRIPRFRHDGRWWLGDLDMSTTGNDDAFFAKRIADGLARRLVPEANGG